MAEIIDTDVCVIGAGSGGLSVAAGASQMGARVVLCERHLMGGDCLNHGCVPSKALLAAGRHAVAWRQAAAFGLQAAAPEVDWAKVAAHVEGVIAAIAPQDSQARFEGLGVRVLRAEARFAGPREVACGDALVRAKWIVLATGSRPFVPPVPGLAEVAHFTNETIFANAAPIGHLLVLGGGPIGLELAQAHRRLGAEVTVLEQARLLPKDDPEAAGFVARALAAEGVRLQEGVKVLSVAAQAGGVVATVEDAGGRRQVAGTHLLVAAGRRTNLENLDLAKAGIAVANGRLVVDARLRTSNRRVFAVGDVAGGLQFTHVAGYHAGIAIRNMLFRLPAKASDAAIPWVTYTDPELAHVGLTEQAARAQGAAVNVLRWPFAENDRAQAERQTAGMLKAIVTPKGRILGATVVGPHAGELIQPWVLALGRGLGIGAMASAVAAYPTFGEVSKRAAGSFYMPRLFAERTRKVVRFLMRFA